MTTERRTDRQYRRDSDRARWRRDLILVSALLILIFGGVIYLRSQERDRTEDLVVRAGTLNCDDLSALTDYLIAEVGEEIRKTRNANPALFPDIPPAKFHRLIERQIRNQRQDRRDLPQVNCTVRFADL
jgi:hypothetical protein